MKFSDGQRARLTGALAAMSLLLGACSRPALAAADAPIDQKPPETASQILQMSASQDLKIYPKRALSLTECFDLGNRNNKEIAVAEKQLLGTKAGVITAAANPNPVFNSTYGFGPAWEYIAAGNNQQVGWSQELQVLGKRVKKIGVANAQYGAGIFTLQETRFDVHNRIRRAYAELAAAVANSRLVESQRQVAVKLVDIAAKRYDAGKAPASEVLQAKLALMQYGTMRNLAQGRLVQDTAQLSQLIGELPEREEIIQADVNSLFERSQADTVVVPSVDRGVPPLPSLLPAAWNQRNDLKAAIQTAFADKRSHNLAKTFCLPDPTVGFNFMYTTYKKLQPIYLVGNAPFQPGFQVEVSHETPIFYHYHGERNLARATWFEQCKQNDLLTSQIAVSIVTSYEALVTASANIVKFEKELLPAAADVAQLNRRSYQLGKSDLASAMLAQQQYQQIRSNYFDAVVAYQNAWADLESAVGAPIST